MAQMGRQRRTDELLSCTILARDLSDLPFKRVCQRAKAEGPAICVVQAGFDGMAWEALRCLTAARSEIASEEAAPGKARP